MDVKEVWKASFFRDQFSVDQCLAGYTQKSDLESLLRDLKNYGNELQGKMSEILKNETEAIVNLAEYLTNLNSKISNLTVPISQLQEEIRTLFGLVESAESNYKAVLEDVECNNAKQNHMHLKMGLIKCCSYINSVLSTVDYDSSENLLTLERLVNNYSFQKIYLEELNLVTPEVTKICLKIDSDLINKVNEKFMIALKKSDTGTLLKCLRMYVNLQKQEEAQTTFQVHILRPELLPLFSESYLEKCDYNIDKIYNEVVKILESKVNRLTQIIEENPDLKCFNFVLNSFWREFDKQSREGLPHITAPGNPELFQKRFISTWNLLQFIAEKCGDKELVRENASFVNHLKRFNLPVYFEIKFQQIAGSFETEIYNIQLTSIQSSQNKHSFKLKPSVVLWNTIESCFQHDVYIDQLADQFLRLSLMAVSRYTKLMGKLLDGHFPPGTENYDDLIISTLIDLHILKGLIAPHFKTATDLDKTVFSIINKSMSHILLKIFNSNKQVINRVQGNLQDRVVQAKVSECIGHLQNVCAIPRLYRRTNRYPPKEASSYMIEAVKPILDFHNKFKSKIDELLDQIVDSIISQITRHYSGLVQEVLRSVCKTEESLRRLKSRTSAPMEDPVHGSSDTMSDESKIREQIKYDVGYFLDKLHPLGLQSTKEGMDSLRREVY
ncbi:conserved oligomeric Golgi complex subunit 2 [Cylas formicarius]|uniref:conserved oligomeric Golgi complex subunit 2 n=1 Tax=Cylas formicarius TaxID=197179 RepID=UPI002958A917|nr:conserved oligomeric Golgi complex subunit 2 [Cylas formicarius]